MNECMEIEERETNKIILNVTEALISFICYDDGDRLACKIFISLTVFHIICMFYLG